MHAPLHTCCLYVCPSRLRLLSDKDQPCEHCTRAGRLREEVWDLAEAGVLASAELLHLRDAASQAAAAQVEIARLREVSIPSASLALLCLQQHGLPRCTDNFQHRQFPRPVRGIWTAEKQAQQGVLVGKACRCMHAVLLT